jgi:hypothetical protein
LGKRFVTAEWAKDPGTDPFIGPGKGFLGVLKFSISLSIIQFYDVDWDSVEEELQYPQGQHADHDCIGHILGAPGDQDRQYARQEARIAKRNIYLSIAYEQIWQQDGRQDGRRHKPQSLLYLAGHFYPAIEDDK